MLVGEWAALWIAIGGWVRGDFRGRENSKLAGQFTLCMLGLTPISPLFSPSYSWQGWVSRQGGPGTLTKRDKREGRKVPWGFFTASLS